MAELHRYEKCAFPPSMAGFYPSRRVRTPGTFPRNKLALRLGCSGFSFDHRLRTAFSVVAALGHDHSRDSVFEDELFLVVSFQHDRILVEGPYAAREFDAAQEIYGYLHLLFARGIEK